mmetsp:Transcript_26247/g.26496  ORF Transcript_26247/g.26496 Transcript_26247/m.26496 type:complete len:81 (+) Transcript_26247:80-322(+)
MYYEDLWLHTDESLQLLSLWTSHPLINTDTIYVKQSDTKISDIPNITDIRKFLHTFNPCLEAHVDSINPALSCLSTRQDR